MSLRLLIALAAFFALTFSAAAFGAAFTERSVRTWYPKLRKPPGNPPATWFGPVWTVLYLLMALSAWNVWRVTGGWDEGTPAITVFLIQLALNAVWSVIFFGLRAPVWALLEMALLWIAVLTTVILFWKVSALSGAMLLPYLTWVSYAAYLNVGIWRMNREHH